MEGSEKKTRRRGAALEAALLDAAWQELQSVGYANLTIDAVAARAGTSRAVIYRRWRNKPQLIVAAIRRFRPVLSAEVPDTGSLRGDLLELMGRYSRLLSEIGSETIYGLLGDYFADPELFAFLREQVANIGSGVMAEILAKAAERGEAAGDIDGRVATLPLDLLRHELFLSREPVSQDVIHEIVDNILLPLIAPRNEERS